MSEEQLVRGLFSYLQRIGLYDCMTVQTREFIKEKYLYNPPYLMILTPSGKWYEYVLEHTDSHIKGCQLFCHSEGMMPNLAIYNDYKLLEDYIAKQQCFIVKTWLDLGDFQLYCQLIAPDVITEEQQFYLNMIYEDYLNEENSYLEEELENRKLYVVDETIRKDKMR